LRVASPTTKGLSILDVESGRLTPLTPDSGSDNLPAWSPKGDAIAFTSNRARGGFKDEMARGGGGQAATDVFVMRADGSDVRRLTDDAAEEGTVAFAWK
jgi:TolB protein